MSHSASGFFGARSNESDMRELHDDDQTCMNQSHSLLPMARVSVFAVVEQRNAESMLAQISVSMTAHLPRTRSPSRAHTLRRTHFKLCHIPRRVHVRVAPRDAKRHLVAGELAAHVERKLDLRARVCRA
jgi:hypothetical protein